MNDGGTPIFDAHLDLAFNALSYEREQSLPLEELRQSERAMTDHDRGPMMVSFPELRRGGVVACLATIFSRCRPLPARVAGARRSDYDFSSYPMAHAYGRAQAAYYEAHVRGGWLRPIRTARELKDHWTRCATASPQPIGYILAMEGCDPVLGPDDVAAWWMLGLRAASLAHYGPSRYAHGSGGDGPLTPAGRDLLREFARLGICLDLTHTSDTSWRQAYDLYEGPIFASHNNCRALIPGDRQFSDDQIRRLIARGGVIGVVLDNWMLTPGYVPRQTDRQTVTLRHVADQIDHICQLAGNAHHAGIGSDLDGGFTNRQAPADLDSIADLGKLSPLLRSRGYSNVDVTRILGTNWHDFFVRSLPA
jgi:membrane dipeptidase